MDTIKYMQNFRKCQVIWLESINYTMLILRACDRLNQVDLDTIKNISWIKTLVFIVLLTLMYELSWMFDYYFLPNYKQTAIKQWVKKSNK